MAYTNKGLVEYAKKCLALGENSVYVYGSFGNKLTASFATQKYKQYPSINTSARTTKYKNLCDGKHYAFDCVGLIKSYYWGGYGNTTYKSSSDVSANGMYTKAKVKGDIKTIDLNKPGLLVQMDGHIGISVGDGSGDIIESTISTKHAKQKHGLGGVCKTNIKDRKWLHWLECPYIEYVAETKKETTTTTTATKTQSTVSYYPKCSIAYLSIVSALNSIGVNSTFAYRKKIAAKNNIANYKGSATQNIKMLNLLKKGKLIKV